MIVLLSLAKVDIPDLRDRFLPMKRVGVSGCRPSEKAGLLAWAWHIGPLPAEPLSPQ